MTTVYLCQIPTFSSDYKNVGHFTSRSSQINYMQQKCVLNLTTNAKIDNFTDNITFNYTMNTNMRKCDYLYAQGTDGRYFFFFIVNMEQLTTSTVKVYLELDVWQTYHLDLVLLPSFVERCHVNRWKTTNIPSKEIVSEPFGNYESTVIKEENVPNNKGVYVIASTTPLGKVSNRPSGGSGGGGCGNPSEGIPSPKGFLFIKGYEGLAQYAHNIGDGVMTIGYGCTDAYEDAKEKVLEAGMDAYLSKPVYVKDLYLVLDRVLQKDKRT